MSYQQEGRLAVLWPFPDLKSQNLPPPLPKKLLYKDGWIYKDYIISRIAKKKKWKRRVVSLMG